MREVKIGIIGLGNVGGGTLSILTQNRAQIEQKLGFPLTVAVVASRTAKSKTLPAGLDGVLVTEDWREVVAHPDVEVVAELVGGTGVAREIVEAAIAAGKAVVTANKELMGLDGVALGRAAAEKGVPLAMEASVCGGIPIHAVLKEGICGDRVRGFFGILNGTSNYILTEIEKHGTAFDDVLKEAQRLGYAEADPTADIGGFDARSKLVLLALLAFGMRIAPADVPTEGIQRITPTDFRYARQVNSTIRLICGAEATDNGLFLSVRPSLIPLNTIMAGVQGAYNAVWVKGDFGADTFYYGRGAGALPTGVAVVSDLMRAARELRGGSATRVSPFAFPKPVDAQPREIGEQVRPWYLRFRVADRPGIIAALSAILAEHEISIDAVLQLADQDWRNLPFVITVEKTEESRMRRALERMAGLDFMIEPPLALPMESGL
ncbi:MAG: homoserine dehydrogenase [Bryobacteraceae bacterium]|nr:homoserine dehydrogenase [Bryobacteraceae bacterium]